MIATMTEAIKPAPSSEKLKKTMLIINGKERLFLDEVNVILSVSEIRFTAGYYGLFVEGLFQGFEQRFLKKNIRDTLTARVFFDPVNGLSSAQRLFHEHGSNTSQSGLCKGTAEDASGVTRPLISSEST